MNQKTIREISDAWRENKRPYVKQSTLAAYMLILEITFCQSLVRVTNFMKMMYKALCLKSWKAD